MKYTKYPELKNELKQLAKEIKELKHMRDNWWDFKHMVSDSMQWCPQSVFMCRVARKSGQFRHKHIAYCMLRGRKYEEIEQPGHYNRPDMVHVQLLMEKYDKKEIKFRTVQHA